MDPSHSGFFGDYYGRSGPISKKSERDERWGRAVEKIKRDILDNLFYLQGKFPEVATLNDWYLAVAHMVKDRLMNVG